MKNIGFAVASVLISSAPALGAGAILPPTSTPTVVSTVPANGDVNPYGVAFVPRDFPSGGPLHANDILVSNFNAKSNLQGTGTTIVDVRGTTVTQFFQGTPTLGLTTALAVLRSGFVIVGNIPSPTGNCSDPTTGAGSLLVIDRNGNLIEPLAGAPVIDGPWDMTVVDSGDEQGGDDRAINGADGEGPTAFVANAFNGTVYRLNLEVDDGKLKVQKATLIARGYSHQCDPTTFVDGPTGLAFDPGTGALYVASTLDNAVYRVINAATRSSAALKGHLVFSDATHLNGPLALALAPNGHLITANNDNTVAGSTVPPSEYVEFTKSGTFVGAFQIDSSAGGAFGLAIRKTGPGTGVFAAVDDNVPNLQIFDVNF